MKRANLRDTFSRKNVKKYKWMYFFVGKCEKVSPFTHENVKKEERKKVKKDKRIKVEK